MSLSQSPIHIRASDATEQLNLGILINYNPLPTPANIQIFNESTSAKTITLRLSDSLTSHLTLCQHYDPISTPTESLPQNANLLHTNLAYHPQFTIPSNKLVDLTIHFLTVDRDLPADHVITVEGTLDARFDHCISTLNLVAKLSLSLIRPHVNKLHFTHTSPHSPVTLPLVIQNLTQVDTRFQLSCSVTALPPLFTTESGAPLPSEVPLPADSSYTLHVTLSHPSPQPRSFVVQNLLCSDNFSYVTLSESAADTFTKSFIELDCGPELDFGDCYMHCRTFRDVRLTSKAEEKLMVGLSSDRRAQVTFELLSAWPQGDPVSHMELNSGEFPRLHEVFERPMSPLRRRVSAIRLGDDFGGIALSRQSSSGALFAPLPRSKANAVEVTQISVAPKTRLVELVVLEPGESRSVRVWYLPLPIKDGRAQSEFDRRRLVTDSFLVTFKLAEGGKVSVVGRSRVCESVLRLEREGWDLGNCDVLAKYRVVLSVINCSDLPASASIDYVSQCVTADEHEVHIAPRKTLDIGLSFVPRQVNPRYHKEITVTNRRNPHSPNQVFRMTANCVDRQGISLHALFYKILAPNPTNEIDFGVTVANHPAIRAFRVRNISKGKLTLKFMTGNGLQTYIPTWLVLAKPWQPKNMQHSVDGVRFPDVFHATAAYGPSDLERDGEGADMFRTVNALVDKKMRSRNYKPAHSLFLQQTATSSEDYCEMEMGTTWDDIRSGGSESGGENEGDSDNDDKMFEWRGEKSWLEFLKCLDERDFALLDSVPMFFSNHSSEVSYTERQFRPMRRLRAALRDGYLHETDIVALEPDAESLVVVSLVLTDRDVESRSKTRPFEKRLIVNILEFDNSRLSAAASTSSKELNDIVKQFEHERNSMPRAVLLTVRACKSRMRISPLRQLNFGDITVGEQKDKAFTIVNISDAPLLYAVKKERREGNELRLNVGKGIAGVVGPYSSKVVPFIYAPTVEGRFEETIMVENRLDRSASCRLVVKATVGR